jgi:hypothetical protein
MIEALDAGGSALGAAFDGVAAEVADRMLGLRVPSDDIAIVALPHRV